jgi:hypothetical protein
MNEPKWNAGFLGDTMYLPSLYLMKGGSFYITLIGLFSVSIMTGISTSSS